MKLTLIGDIHGLHTRHQEIIRDKEHTIALGDMGFDSKTYGKFMDLPTNHYFLRGNHDPLNICIKMKFCLCNYGTLYNNNLFYVAGAQTPVFLRELSEEEYTTEELSQRELDEATYDYRHIRPRIMISHTAPELIVWDILPNNYTSTKTTQSLQIMFNFHKPDYWIFGHFHKEFNKVIDNCTFICLPPIDTPNSTLTLDI